MIVHGRGRTRQRGAVGCRLLRARFGGSVLVAFVNSAFAADIIALTQSCAISASRVSPLKSSAAPRRLLPPHPRSGCRGCRGWISRNTRGGERRYPGIRSPDGPSHLRSRAPPRFVTPNGALEPSGEGVFDIGRAQCRYILVDYFFVKIARILDFKRLKNKSRHFFP